MTNVSIDHFRDTLLAERRRVQGALETLHQENSTSLEEETGELVSSSLDDHMGDLATETHDREVEYGLEDNAEAVLKEIDSALKRIDEGTYGRCEVCGREIDQARLEARPWATLCIDDQRRREHG